MMGMGVVGFVGAGLGAIAGFLAPGGERTVVDRPSSPTLTLSLSPGGTSVLDEVAPYGISISFDPEFVLDEVVGIRPHLAFSTSLGASRHVDPRPQHTETIRGQDATFPVVFSAWGMKLAAGAEVGIKLPYPSLGPARPFMGRLEFRYRPRWEMRRRVIQPGQDNHQATEHHALYPAMFGFRWHLSPRQRFTAWVGPRIDFIGFTNPGSREVRRGPGNIGTFHAEAWYQLDIPFTPEQGRKTSVTARINLGYVHSNLDGDGFDFAAAIGFFGPFEVSFDLRLRRLGAPAALQLTAGLIVGTGGGAFFEIGLVAPSIQLEQASE
jgi:hypothetical protein